jgi:hypothetical protein
MKTWLCVLLVWAVCSTEAFRPRAALSRPRATSTTTSTALPAFGATLLESAALDYSAEIENAVGTEIYTPIFKAGLGLFASGILAAVAAAFIISKADTYDGLAEEFERGKVKQLISMDAPKQEPVTAAPTPATQSQEAPPASANNDVKGLDL